MLQNPPKLFVNTLYTGINRTVCRIHCGEVDSREHFGHSTKQMCFFALGVSFQNPYQLLELSMCRGKGLTKGEFDCVSYCVIDCSIDEGMLLGFISFTYSTYHLVQHSPYWHMILCHLFVEGPVFVGGPFLPWNAQCRVCGIDVFQPLAMVWWW